MNNSLLPANSTALERNLEQVTQRSTDLPLSIQDIYNPAKCPAALLPWLAWAWMIEQWDSNLSEEQKRAVLADAFIVHSKRGTVASVKRILKNAGYECEIIEGLVAKRYAGRISHNGHFFYGGQKTEHWASFRVYLKQAITKELAQKVRGLIESTMPARCKLFGIHHPIDEKHDGTKRYNGQLNYGVY